MTGWYLWEACRYLKKTMKEWWMGAEEEEERRALGRNWEEVRERKLGLRSKNSK